MVLVSSKMVRRMMLAYFHNNEWSYETTITDVEVYLEGNKTFIEITTHRPGILIGKAGRFIDGLKEWISKQLDQEVQITLKECKLWSNLYN